MGSGPALSADRCMGEGEDTGDMSRIAKSIMVNNAFIPPATFLSNALRSHLTFVHCLFPLTALALVKLLRVPELQHSWQG